MHYTSLNLYFIFSKHTDVFHLTVKMKEVCSVIKVYI
jgi:hypothetical protein